MSGVENGQRPPDDRAETEAKLEKLITRLEEVIRALRVKTTTCRSLFMQMAPNERNVLAGASIVQKILNGKYKFNITSVEQVIGADDLKSSVDPGKNGAMFEIPKEQDSVVLAYFAQRPNQPITMKEISKATGIGETDLRFILTRLSERSRISVIYENNFRSYKFNQNENSN